MRKREKLGVGVAMSMGIIAGVMATTKTLLLTKLSTNDSCKHTHAPILTAQYVLTLMADDAAALTTFDTAEVSVTIMAASIPAMRVLFRDLRSSARRYYGSYDPSGIATTNPERRYRGHSHSTQIKSQARDLKDDSSDKEILSPSAGSSKILRVDEVEIEYRARSDRAASASEHGEAYEMHLKR
jgi:hypothetical protein